MERNFSAQFESSSVDKVAGIIYGVSVITEGIAAGHGEYVDALTLSQVMACAAKYAGGLKVVDRHTRGTDSVFSTVGSLKNFRIEGNKLRADMHLLQSESNRGKLLEMADSIPDTFGLSIAFSGPRETKEGKVYTRCDEIYNAALVDVPAANPNGLFSKAVQPKIDAPTINNMTTEEFSTYKEGIDAQLKQFGTLLAEIKAALPKEDKAAEFTKLQATVTELTAKLDKVPDIASIAQSIAREFTKVVGASPAAPASPAHADPVAKAPAAEQAFLEVVQKHFAATKSKVKATQLAIKDEPTSYAAFTASGKNINWK